MDKRWMSEKGSGWTPEAGSGVQEAAEVGPFSLSHRRATWGAVLHTVSYTRPFIPGGGKDGMGGLERRCVIGEPPPGDRLVARCVLGGGSVRLRGRSL
jgi:hypothetical protein